MQKKQAKKVQKRKELKAKGYDVMSESELSMNSESIDEELLNPNPGKIKNLLFLRSKANLDRLKKLENEESLKQMV